MEEPSRLYGLLASSCGQAMPFVNSNHQSPWFYTNDNNITEISCNRNLGVTELHAFQHNFDLLCKLFRHHAESSGHFCIQYSTWTSLSALVAIIDARVGCTTDADKLCSACFARIDICIMLQLTPMCFFFRSEVKYLHYHAFLILPASSNPFLVMTCCE